MSRQVEQCGNKHPKCVILSLRQNCIGSTKCPQQWLHEKDSKNTEANSDQHGDSHNSRHGTAGSLLILCPQLPAGKHRCSRRKYIFYRNHNEQQRQSHAHRCKGNIAVQHPNICRIYDVINCFCQKSQRGRYCEFNNRFRWHHRGQQRFLDHILICFHLDHLTHRTVKYPVAGDTFPHVCVGPAPENGFPQVHP